MSKIRVPIIIFIITVTFLSCSKVNKLDNTQSERFSRLMFYNVENLFDIYDDPEINDEEFMPESKKAWTVERYNEKLNNIASIIIAVGELDPPDIIGLCEIENYTVLEDLVTKTKIKNLNYGIIHKDSPDKRGIDVAILYRKDKVKPLTYSSIRVKFEDPDARPTRDIIYFKSIVRETDTIHYFVNHWPSRSGGQEKSEVKRLAAAKVVKAFTDSILNVNNKAKLILTGDFNDDPDNNSLTQILRADTSFSEINLTKLYSLSYQHKDINRRGTLKYKGKWNVFDQFIVSGNLISDKEGVHTSLKNSLIFYGTDGNDFLLETDDRYVGMQPNRTYWGPQFHGGYSDHLPVYLDLIK